MDSLLVDWGCFSVLASSVCGNTSPVVRVVTGRVTNSEAHDDGGWSPLNGEWGKLMRGDLEIV